LRPSNFTAASTIRFDTIRLIQLDIGQLLLPIYYRCIKAPKGNIALRKWLNPGWLAGAVAIGIVLIYYVIYWQSVRNFVVAIDQCDTLFCDFFRHFYPMGKEIFISFQPVQGFFYSPFAAILLGWTTFLTTRSALVVWGLLQAAVIALYYIIPMVDLFGRSRAYPLIYSVIFITSLPLLHNLKWGQISALLALLVLVALYLYDKGYKIPSAILLALAISIKYYPAIFLVYFLFRRDFRYLAICLAACLAFMLLLPSALLGIGHTVEFYRLAGHAASQATSSWMEKDLNSQYIAKVFGRLFPLNLQGFSQTIIQLLGYLVSSVNIALLGVLVVRGVQKSSYWAWILLFTTLPFWLTTSWPHYFVYLPLAQIFVLILIDQNRSPRWSKIVRLVAWGGSVVFSNVIFFNLIGRWQFYSNKGFLFFSNALLLLVIYSLLCFPGNKSDKFIV
jgi:alpha-1,2-mannosyltransferase